MSTKDQVSKTEGIAAGVPYLRRYARALTGSQPTGDRYAAAALEAILADEQIDIDDGHTPKVMLFRAFHLVWSSAGSPVGAPDTALAARAQYNMSKLTPHSREALLLHAIEGFDFEEIGQILDLTGDEARESVDIARRELDTAVRGKVMIIEDEAIIALDIAAIVEEIGHTVTGIARTHEEALRLAARAKPNLILADIKLADNSSGIDAVNDILGHFDRLPVIFITAFPERLLTGDRPEPAFLITKPFTEEQVRSAVSQAMFFASTETLAA
ncbi:response regulator [Defluviimonas sp. WL0002]|uniref:Response regulator n=1 Tax=Albidovulum marisflavi TaxID=2984159 RepID=A0ABT2ZDF0_9RHOB|nr:response regulator [Defluviimonas sp. WL0002]MCV2869106.1 response regulator [Defluviimonas sp. WL0002]